MANTLSAVRYGRYKTSPEADFGNVSAGYLRACVFDALDDNTWFESISIIAGKFTGTNCTIDMSMWATDGSGDPDDREGYTASGSISSSKVDASGGVTTTLAFTNTADSPSNSAVAGFSGNRYGLGFTNTVATICHSMRAAASITATNKQFYDKSGQSIPPPSSFGANIPAVEGHITMWANGWKNVAPEAPTALSPSGSITSTAPTFTADFSDKNGDYGDDSNLGIDTGDHLTTYRIRVRRVSDGTYFWQQTYTAIASEISADLVSRVYAGTALVRGTAYEWRIQVADYFGEYSEFSAWTAFTPASQGYVTLDSTPTGKQEVITGIDFKGRWNHQSATTMKTVEIKLLDGSGTVLDTSSTYDIADVASSALPGTLFTIPWASTGFADLSWGQDYQYQIRGYDGTNWSDWSTARSFNTNAAPYIPVGLSPSGDLSFTSLPLLSAAFTDDDDDSGTGLTGVFRITRPNLTTVDVTPTYNATTILWEFQTTITQLNAFGAYSFIATGYDGTLYSGEAALLASAAWSSAAEFNYVNGPIVTVSQPTNNATWIEPNMDVMWTTSTTQVSYRIWVYADNDADTVIYDSGLITSSVQTHSIPAGYFENLTDYDLVVEVVDVSVLTGYSPIVNFYVEYTPADPTTNFSAIATKIADDAMETAIRVSWDQTTYSSPDFHEYILKRTANAGTDEEEIFLRRFRSPATTAYTDYLPASGYEYTYSLLVVIYVGNSLVTSEIMTTVETVDFTGVVLSQVGNGGTYRVYLTNVTERSHSRLQNEKFHLSLNRTRPVTIKGKAHYWETSLTGFLIDTTEATAVEKKNRLEELDEQNAVICFRDGRGRKMFCTIVDLSIKDEKPDFYSFTLKLREEHAVEGSS